MENADYEYMLNEIRRQIAWQQSHLTEEELSREVEWTLNKLLAMNGSRKRGLRK
jgi:hypothetical protein